VIARDLPACAVAIVAAGTLAPHAMSADRASTVGRIEGEIEPVGSVVKVSAVDRDVKQEAVGKEVKVREIVGRILRGGAGYVIEATPGTYDLHVELKGSPRLGDAPSDGRIIEGADLRGPERSEKPEPLKTRDRDRITDVAKKMRTWSDEKHVLAIEGAAGRAKALVKLVRTEPTSYDGEFGEPIAVVRWEIWNFRKYTGSWRREPKAKVLRRFLFPKRKLAELRWEFDPALGGVDIRPGEATRRDLDFRPKPKADTPTESSRPPPEPPPGFAR
jgi:hypothetical protein